MDRKPLADTVIGIFETRSCLSSLLSSLCDSPQARAGSLSRSVRGRRQRSQKLGGGPDFRDSQAIPETPVKASQSISKTLPSANMATVDIIRQSAEPPCGDEKKYLERQG